MFFPILSTLKLAMLLHKGNTAKSPTNDQYQHQSPADGLCTLWTDQLGSIEMECCISPTTTVFDNATKGNHSTEPQQQCRVQINFARYRLDNVEFLHQIYFRRNSANATEYNVIVGGWDGNSTLTADLFSHLRPFKIVSLVLRSANPQNEMPNLGLFFPQLRQLNLIGENMSTLSGPTFLRDLPMLKALKAVNANFSLGDQEPQWSSMVERIELENCTIHGSSSSDELPRWLPKCRRLERVHLSGCALRSVHSIAQLASAVQIRAIGNRFNDLHRSAFDCARLHELNLRENNIFRIGVHTFARCHALRLLDLSDNPLAELPDKLFQGCRRLKELRLERIGILHLCPELFIGLNALKLLSLSGNPLSRIDPFTFLPTRSIRTLNLNNSTLRQIPLAVTQCCMLNSLLMDDNRFASRDSMPPPILALLPRLAHFSFARNPLLQLPWALFLYELHYAEDALLEGIVNTLIQLPVWRLEPCTPYLWHFHLRNTTSPVLRRRIAGWSELRMHREGLAHCGQFELRENNGCEATRRLRSVRANARNSQNNHSKQQKCDNKAEKLSENIDKMKNVEENVEGTIPKTVNENKVSQQKPAAGDIVQLLLAPVVTAHNSNRDKQNNIEAWTMSSTPSPFSPAGFTYSGDDEPSLQLLRHHPLFPLSLGANLILLIALLLALAWRMSAWLGARRRAQFDEIQ